MTDKTINSFTEQTTIADDDSFVIQSSGGITKRVEHLTIQGTVSAGLTASATSIQGGTPLTNRFNEISTCATIGDSVTLPTAIAGKMVTVINNGANSADVFPATSDDLGAGVNLATALAAGNVITYLAFDAITWVSV